MTSPIVAVIWVVIVVVVALPVPCNTTIVMVESSGVGSTMGCVPVTFHPALFTPVKDECDVTLESEIVL